MSHLLTFLDFIAERKNTYRTWIEDKLDHVDLPLYLALLGKVSGG